MIKQFLRYVLPSMAAFAFSGLYSIVDGYFVGNNVGDAGLAAINIAYPMIALVNAVGTGIGIGGAVFVSLTRGEGDAESEKKYLGNTLMFLLGASVVCTLLLLAVYRPFLQAFGATGEVLEGAKTYSLVLILCTALQVFATGCIPLLRNFGAAVGAMPYSVQYLPENVTQPPPIDSFCSAGRSKRKRSSRSAHTSSGTPRKLTHDHGANWRLPCSPSI